jgi:hypothetical protein
MRHAACSHGSRACSCVVLGIPYTFGQNWREHQTAEGGRSIASESAHLQTFPALVRPAHRPISSLLQEAAVGRLLKKLWSETYGSSIVNRRTERVFVDAAYAAIAANVRYSLTWIRLVPPRVPAETATMPGSSATGTKRSTPCSARSRGRGPVLHIPDLRLLFPNLRQTANVAGRKHTSSSPPDSGTPAPAADQATLVEQPSQRGRWHVAVSRSINDTTPFCFTAAPQVSNSPPTRSNSCAATGSPALRFASWQT